MNNTSFEFEADSTFAYHSPADLAREHWDHEDNARYDYLSEAFGDEARILDIQAADDEAFYAEEAAREEAERLGITVVELSERYVEKARLEAEAAKCEACCQRIADYFLPF